MFTLDRVSVALTSLGLGIGLVLSGCASPTEESEADLTSASVTEQAPVTQPEENLGQAADEVAVLEEPTGAIQPGLGLVTTLPFAAAAHSAAIAARAANAVNIAAVAHMQAAARIAAAAAAMPLLFPTVQIGVGTVGGQLPEAPPPEAPVD